MQTHPRCPKGGCGSANCRFHESRPRKLGSASEGYKCVKCGCRLTRRPRFSGWHCRSVAISGALADVVGDKSISAAARSVPKNSQPDVPQFQSAALRCAQMQDAQKDTAKIPGNVPDVGQRQVVYRRDTFFHKGGRYMAGVPDAESRFMLANETYPEEDRLQV